MKTFTGPGPLSYFLLVAFLSMAGAGLVILMSLQGCDNKIFTKPADPVTIHIPNFTIHIVGNEKDTPCKAKGCAKFSEIWIVGYQTSRGIEIDNWVLGHELRHVLNTWNLQFADPD